MILKTDKIGLTLEIDDILLNGLIEKGKYYYPNEFGGFLVGYYSNDNTHLYILDSILPRNYQNTNVSFERSTEGVVEQLDDYYKEIPPKLYIGEWHTHPNSRATPSLTDISAMKVIASESNLKNPILLIIGYTKNQTDLSFYVWFNNKLNKYEQS